MLAVPSKFWNKIDGSERTARGTIEMLILKRKQMEKVWL